MGNEKHDTPPGYAKVVTTWPESDMRFLVTARPTKMVRGNSLPHEQGSPQFEVSVKLAGVEEGCLAPPARFWSHVGRFNSRPYAPGEPHLIKESTDSRVLESVAKLLHTYCGYLDTLLWKFAATPFLRERDFRALRTGKFGHVSFTGEFSVLRFFWLFLRR